MAAYSLDSLLRDLRRDEGKRLRAYQDTLGVWTIGYGHIKGVKPDDVITDMEAEAFLKQDAAAAVLGLEKKLPWSSLLSEPRWRALANMCFNLGLTKLLKFEKMLAALKAGDWDTAAKEALNSNWAAQVGDRAKRIAAAFKDGK